MSGTVFLIEFAVGASLAGIVSMKQILFVLREIAKEMEIARKTSLATLEWVKSKENINIPTINVDLPIFEVKLPSEFTNDIGISNEILRIAPIDDRRTQIVITDANLQREKCEEIAVDFAQRLYEKVTGKKIDRSMIRIERVATLAGKICEYCLQKIDEIPYTCKLCRRTFCYKHRRPETHGCGIKPRGVEKGTPIASESYSSLATEESESEHTPRIIVRRLPCG